MEPSRRTLAAPLRRALWLVCAACLALTPVRRSQDAAQAPRLATVVLVRHAEKATDDPRDPSLSEAGRARAAGLATLFGRAQPTRLVATEYKRTRETLAPLAGATGLSVETRPARDVAGLVAALRAAPAGALTIVAGHSNTVPAIARGLGVELGALVAGPQGAGQVLDEAEYDRVVVLTYPVGAEGRATSVELRVPELRAP